MRGEWCYFKNHFSPEECRKILNDGLTLPASEAALGNSGESSNSDFRRSKVRFIQKTDFNFNWLFDRMWKMAIEANDIWFGFNVTRISFIQLAEYDASYQGEYKRHHDVFWINNDSHYHRKLTAVVQLSNPNQYAGGQLELYELNEYPNAQEIREQGTAVFFPSFITHAALPVTAGTRYSLACWFDGPKWR